MLLKDFYTLDQVTSKTEGNKTNIMGSITINKGHQIFEGHFPGLPIVPGVCMVQIIKETTESHLNKKLSMTAASNIKFLSVINPQNNSQVNVEIALIQNQDVVEVEGKLFFGELTFFKIKATFSNSPE
jgi:3-hydroxyacyl-[acyl-carrier-protein] dehydratase